MLIPDWEMDDRQSFHFGPKLLLHRRPAVSLSLCLFLLSDMENGKINNVVWVMEIYGLDGRNYTSFAPPPFLVAFAAHTKEGNRDASSLSPVTTLVRGGTLSLLYSFAAYSLFVCTYSRDLETWPNWSEHPEA